MTKDLNDRLDDIFGAPTERVLTDRPAAVEYRAKVAEQANYFQKCGRCNGTGTTPWGVCFRCRGSKGKTFKTSPEARAKASEQRADRKERVKQEIIQAWAEANRPEFDWLVKTAPRWDLAHSLLNSLGEFGSLTEKQMAVISNGIARDAAREAAKAAPKAAAPAVDTAGVDRLKAAFDKARAYQAEKGLTLRTPKITIGGTTISPAPAAGKNPGALYVKAGQTYLGKVQDGQFFASRECSEETKAQVLKFVADPADAAKVYGQTTGTCCICNATLRSEWKHRGIGPICAKKFGF